MSGEQVPATTGTVTTALGYTFDTYGRFASLIGTVKNVGITITPDDWVPWFVYDLGLEETIPYVRDYRRVLAEGPTWQAQRGTDSGIAIGIGWVGSTGSVDPPDGRHDWWEFQVGFPEPASDIQQIRQIEGIIRLSKASEDELFRMFSPARDHRPVRFDRHRFDTGGQFDGYSGVKLWDGGPLISFGWAATIIADFEPLPLAGTEIETTAVIPWFDGMRFDRDRLDRDRPRTIVTGSIDVETSGDAQKRADAWPSAWPRGSWLVEIDATPIATPLEIS